MVAAASVGKISSCGGNTGIPLDVGRWKNCALLDVRHKKDIGSLNVGRGEPNAECSRSPMH